MVSSYKCPYCNNEYCEEDIKRHMNFCYGHHRNAAKKKYSEAAKRRVKDKEAK